MPRLTARFIVSVAVILLVAAPAAVAALDFQHVHALAVDAAGRTLWVGAHSGLYRTEDGGRTWSRVALPGPAYDPDVMAVTPHPSEPAVLYVGTHAGGVLKTTDGGKTWTAANTGLGGLDVHGLALDPNTPTKLYALVREQGAGVYRTTDSGGRWVRVDDGPPGETKALASVNISLLAMSVLRPSVPTPAPDVVFRTLDARPARLADLRGRPVLLTFFTTW